MANRDPSRYEGSGSISVGTTTSGVSVSSGGTKIVNVVLPRQNVPTVFKITDAPRVNVNTYVNDVFVQASPGPQGIPGSSGLPPGEEEVYSTRVDFVNDNLIYRAEAAVGTLNVSPVWRIRRLIVSNDGDISEEWANGNANFVNIWDNRANLSYR